jgi:hypothetical protein
MIQEQFLPTSGARYLRYWVIVYTTSNANDGCHLNSDTLLEKTRRGEVKSSNANHVTRGHGPATRDHHLISNCLPFSLLECNSTVI